MDDRSFAALLVGFVSATPAISMIKGMDLRGKVMNAAFLVCGASALAFASRLYRGRRAEPDLSAAYHQADPAVLWVRLWRFC